MKNETFDIDFVIPWVDGSDPAWIKEFNKYCPEDKQIIDASEKRFRDYGLLKYWFRGVEKFAPWVRKVHFITCGQKPEWLNLDAPKLHWVQHKDYIPQEYLPVFSSHPIELMMHKIPGLAEQIVYFNDDFFLTSPVRNKFFFRKGLPCDSAILGTNGFTSFGHIPLNNTVLINSKFSKKEVLWHSLDKWFNLKYGTSLIKTMLLLPFSGFSGFYNPHFAVPYTKSLLEEVWENFPDALTLTMKQRFRSKQDVNQYLFRNYRSCTGKFYPVNPHHRKKYFSLTNANLKLIVNAIKEQKFIQIVINDTEDSVDFENTQKCLIDAFQSILPEKSSFEI